MPRLMSRRRRIPYKATVARKLPETENLRAAVLLFFMPFPNLRRMLANLFGLAKVGERGQIVIPKKARELFGIKPGDSMMILGDENPPFPGIALIKNEIYVELIERIMATSDATEEEKGAVREILDAQRTEA